MSKKMNIGDVIDSISTTHLYNKEYLIFLNTSDIYNGEILHNNYTNINELPGQAKKTIMNEDILFSEIRPKNRRFCMVQNLENPEDYVISTKLMVLRIKDKYKINVSSKYMYYSLTNEQLLDRLQLIAQNRSGTFPQITFSHLSEMCISLPPLEEQQKIADLLSSLDNKIELNNQINKDLEELAQTLYTKWFVNFDFPNEEGKPYKSNGGEMIDSELGEIPDGWSVSKMIDYFDFNKGIEVGSSNYLDIQGDDTIRFIRVGDMSSLDGDKYIQKSLVANNICNPKDVLVSMDGSVGRVVNGLYGCYSSGMRNVIPKTELFNSKGFIYLLLKSERTQYTINQFAQGSIIKHAGKSINHIKFIVPQEEYVNKFKEIIEPLYNQIIENKLENQQLKETRDLLLPYLMSGKINLN